MTEEEYQDYDDYYDQPARGNRTWLIVAIVVVVILLCCCCLALVAGLALLNEDIIAELGSFARALPALEGITASG
jgi:hypothetical protein